MERKLGIVVFSSDSGLGNQSRRLTQMLKPERILLIDSTPFSKNKDQHPEWYDGFQGFVSKGFPSDRAVDTFLNGLTHLYLIENPLNWRLITEAHKRGVKTYIASNYEFCDNLRDHNLPLPDMFLMPSYWNIDDMEKRFGAERIKYLPPPIEVSEFSIARNVNLSRTGPKRFLHVVGTLAAEDRNGTLDVIRALQYSQAGYELVIKSQHELPREYFTNDRRITYKIGNEPDVQDLFKDFDAMIMPRKFGGLCLPMNEALMSALPVIMTDISPNYSVLPRQWLIPSYRTGDIITRTKIDLYSADAHALGVKIDELANTDLTEQKLEAFEIATKRFSPAALCKEYDQLWS